MKKLIFAFSFLTIVPMPHVSSEMDDKHMGGTSIYFPIVGLLQGLLLLLFAIFLAKVLPLEIVAALLVALLVVSNGGFHLDGLSDTFDALASRKDKERMLEIMKDSTTGPIGITAVVLVLLLKYLALKSILSLDLSLAFPLVLFPAAGKWSMVVGLSQSKSAAPTGLGRIFLDHTGSFELVVSTGLVLMIAAITSVVTMGWIVNSTLVMVNCMPFAGVFLFSSFFVALLKRTLGGLTGDNLGAMNEINEVLFLLLFIAVYTR